MTTKNGRLALILTTGFAMFSMFFGSGNLVFPIQVGMQSDGHTWFASLGILLTGVLVPLLGSLVILLYRGENHNFFATMGKSATFWLPLVALSLMGPFGVAARCITVAHGSFVHLYAATPLWLFSLLMCAIIFLSTRKQSKVLSLLGTYLTPLLLVSMSLIIIFGLWFGLPVVAAGQGEFHAVANGLLQGYQTMDLIAAFFFSTFVIHHLPDSLLQDGGNRNLVKTFLAAATIGMSLLALIYVGMTYLGASYSNLLQGVAPEQLLGSIAFHAMGASASIVVCIAVVLACFTTAVVLVSLFAEFLQVEITKNKLSEKWAMIISLLITFLISTLEFSGIAAFLKPILDAVYPALIVLTAMGISHKLWKTKIYRSVVVATFLVTLACQIYGFVAN